MGCSDVLHGRCSPTRQHNHLQVYTGATNTLLIIILVIQQYIATYKQVDSFAFVPAENKYEVIFTSNLNNIFSPTGYRYCILICENSFSKVTTIPGTVQVFKEYVKKIYKTFLTAVQVRQSKF